MTTIQIIAACVGSGMAGMFGAFALVGGKLRPMREALDRSYGEEYESFLHRLRAERERDRASAAAGSLRKRLALVADILRGQNRWGESRVRIEWVSRLSTRGWP